MSTEPANPIEVRMARLEGFYEQIYLRRSSLGGQVGEIRGDVRGLRADLDTKFSALDGKMEGLRADDDARFASLRAYTDSHYEAFRRDTAAQ